MALPITFGPLDNDVPVLVLIHRQAGHYWVWDDTGGQDNGFRLNRFVRQVDRARLYGPHRGVNPEFRPSPPTQNTGSIIRQLCVDFRHDAVTRLEEDEPDLVTAHMSVKWSDLVHQRGQFAE